MKHWTKSAAVAVMIGITFFSSGCGAKKSAAAETRAPLVKTMTVGSEKAASSKTFSGTVHGYFESPLAFQTGGRIVARYVTSGDRVAAGEALMKVDSKDAEEQRAAAESALVSAEAQYRLAASTLRRYQSLRDVDAISELAMDQTKNSFELAEAQLDSARAALSRAENNLSFTLLTADRDGIIGQTLYEVGQVIAAGTPVLQIVDDSRKDIHISFPEKEYKNYSVGMPCTVTFWALPDVICHGTIREIAASPNTSSGTYDVKVTIEDAPAGAAVGMTAEVRFGEAGKQTIRVPLSAMAQQSETPSVWIVKDGKAEMVAVVTGEYGTEDVEIKEGLSKGDVVITAGTGKLTAGEEVRT